MVLDPSLRIPHQFVLPAILLSGGPFHHALLSVARVSI